MPYLAVMIGPVPNGTSHLGTITPKDCNEVFAYSSGTVPISSAYFEVVYVALFVGWSRYWCRYLSFSSKVVH